MIRTKSQKELEKYIPEIRTEWNVRPISQEQIESCGRNAMRKITQLLEQNPELRDEIKEYAKKHPYHRRKKEIPNLLCVQNKGTTGSYVSC